MFFSRATPNYCTGVFKTGVFSLRYFTSRLNLRYLPLSSSTISAAFLMLMLGLSRSTTTTPHTSIPRWVDTYICMLLFLANDDDGDDNHHHYHTTIAWRSCSALFLFFFQFCFYFMFLHIGRAVAHSNGTRLPTGCALPGSTPCHPCLFLRSLSVKPPTLQFNVRFAPFVIVVPSSNLRRWEKTIAAVSRWKNKKTRRSFFFYHHLSRHSFNLRLDLPALLTIWIFLVSEHKEFLSSCVSSPSPSSSYFFVCDTLPIMIASLQYFPA